MPVQSIDNIAVVTHALHYYEKLETSTNKMPQTCGPYGNQP